MVENYRANMTGFSLKRKVAGILYPPGVTVIDPKIATSLFLILVSGFFSISDEKCHD